jgi:DNA (cytosine-5)-methyltransferase 1
MNVAIRTLSICTGYGGIELGLSAVGDFEPVCYVENEITAAAILAKRMEEGSFPKAPIWSDLRTFDGRPWRGRVALITGGIPCQPFSGAGAKRGVDDHRNMWPEVERLAGELGYPTLFLENVPGILKYYYETIRPSLQDMGYTVKEGLFTAAETGAPHRRQRLFILAYSKLDRDRGGSQGFQQEDRAGGTASTTQIERSGSELALTRHPELQGRVEGTEGCEGSTLGEPAPQGSELANTTGTGLQGQEHGVPSDTTETGSDVAHANVSGLQGDGRAGQEECTEATPCLPLYPPGPDDYEGWTHLLHYLPQVEPTFCRDAYGPTPGVDGRLRATGNGVVPAVAAVAWRYLTEVPMR